MSDLFIGLMSGTSLDGVDGVLVDFSGAAIKVLAHSYAPFPRNLKASLLELNSSGNDELHRAALAENAIVRIFADIVDAVLMQSGVDRKAIVAVGVHGQTVRHRPQEFDADPVRGCAGGYTLQLNNPALLAELTNIDVVADFRRRDVAAGGQGAPLVPAFHQAIFGRTDESVAVLNIGGMSNITLLIPDADISGDGILGFDCGPGNALMDHWCQQQTGEPFDARGQWAASGQVQPALLAKFLDESYFRKAPPKSTGRDLFNAKWLTQKLAAFNALQPVDVQATLTELTARVCCDNLIGAGSVGAKALSMLIVCGGGALNSHLMQRLRDLAGMPVQTSLENGLPPLQVEAAAFAWLARQCIRREAANVPKVTGARGARILGAIYPA